MAKVIIIQDGSLENIYEKTMDYLYAKYHSYLSNLLDFSMSPEEQSRQGYYERLAADIAADADVSGDVVV
ncbi:MAG: hypothetical protein U9Q82_08330 [Chloroflexota bacterium]|nr:hypothetical protein [Chloroflexota bacterium]